MKNGWKQKQLSEVCEKITDGTHQTPTYFDEGFLFLSSRNVTSGKIDWENVKYIDSKQHVDMQRRVSPRLNDILLAKNGTTGVAAMVDRDVPFDLYVSLALLRPSEAVLPAFLLYFINSPLAKNQFTKRLKGIGVPNLHLEEIREVEIPYPESKVEQRRLVDILDEAFQDLAIAEANSEKNLRNARALFDSHLQSVFTQDNKGWVQHKLKSITTKIGSGATPRGGGESYKLEGISLIRSLNVHDLGFRYSKLAFLDDTQAGELSNVEVRPGDVLLNITGASVARCCVVPEDVLPARVNQHVSIIRPIGDKLDSDFLHYLLISTPYKSQLLQTGEEGGSTRQAITKAQIQDFSVEYPATLKEQKTIVASLDAMLGRTNRLAHLYEQKLAALEALKKSLLHQAFTGKL